MTMRWLAAACVVGCVLVGARPASAQVLPAFQVTAPDGAQVPGTALESPVQWLLVYVVPGSSPSDRLVQALGEQWSAERGPRIVFVVAGAPEAAKIYLSAKGGEALAAAARWYADPAGDAWRALKFQGTLAVAGMAGARVDWKIDGVIADPSVVEPAARAWLERP